MPSSRYKNEQEIRPHWKAPSEGETDRCVLKSGVLAAGCLVRLSCTGLKAKGSVRAQN